MGKLSRVRRAAYAAIPRDLDVFTVVEIYDAVKRTITDAQKRVFST